MTFFSFMGEYFEVDHVQWLWCKPDKLAKKKKITNNTQLEVKWAFQRAAVVSWTVGVFMERAQLRWTCGLCFQQHQNKPPNFMSIYLWKKTVKPV